MTRLLVSVRSAAEAQAALAGGADLIDVKEPSRGALGAADPATWLAVAEEIGTARPLSAALGELLEFRTSNPPSLRGYHFAKLGLAGCGETSDWIARWQAALATLPETLFPVAVAYADYRAAQAPHPREICAVGRGLGCTALLIDTFEKSRGNVFDVIPLGELREVLKEARQTGMLTVLAGSLKLELLEQALQLAPDYVGVRGAVCHGDRVAELSTDLVREWSNRLASVHSATALKHSISHAEPETARIA